MSAFPVQHECQRGAYGIRDELGGQEALVLCDSCGDYEYDDKQHALWRLRLIRSALRAFPVAWKRQV